MRPIDADDVRDAILHDPDYDNDTINHFLDVIDYAPTLDLVPAPVRCGECEYAEYEQSESNSNTQTCYCEQLSKGMKQSDFCSYGKRKEQK